MQNLDSDLKDAFDKILMGTWQERVIGLAKYFGRDATFTHISFRAFNRDDIWGIYQLWSMNNRSIGIDYLEIIADHKGNAVILEVLEHCHVWWFPPFVNQDVKIHTILDLRDTPSGKVIVQQYDHTLVMESILYHQFPWLGNFANKYILPNVGKSLAGLGYLLYQRMNEHGPVPDMSMPLLVNPESSIPRVAEVIFGSNASYRHALVHKAFTPDAYYYNTALIVVGRQQIFGLFNFWASFNRSVEVRVNRVVPQGDRILVDALQFWTPFFWPPFLHPLAWYNHILITTTDNPAGGKMITRVDNHIIWLEPFLKYNLGPFSRLYEAMRVFNGKLFGLAGRTIHRFLEWQYHHKVPDKIAVFIPNNSLHTS